MNSEMAIKIFILLSMLFFLMCVREMKKRKKEKVKICRLKMVIRAVYYLIIGIMFFTLAAIIARKWEVFAFSIVMLGYSFYHLIDFQKTLKKAAREN